MITCAAAIGSGIRFLPDRVSCSSVFSSRNPFSLTSSHSPIEKDMGRSFQAFECHFLGRVPVHAVATKVEIDSEIDAWTQNLKNIDSLVSTLEDVVPSGAEATSSGMKIKKERNPKWLSNSASESNKPELFPFIRYPLGTESAIKAMLEYNTLVFVVDKRADKKNIKDAMKKMFAIRAKKVNTSIMPNGTKKAYIMLTPEFKAVDVAKKIKIL